MLRGFRWQLLVFLSALALFILSMLSRSTSTPPSPGLTPTPIPPTAPVPTITPAPTSPEPLVLSPIAPATSDSETPTFHEAVVGTVQRLNPLFASMNPVDRDITSLIFEGLTRINEYGEPLPNLAASWVISSDGLEYVIRLRNDVLWQDGIPFTSADVAYTISVLQDPQFPGEPSLGAFWQTVEMQVLDADLVRFRLTQPLGRFLDALSIGILPEHALRGTTAAHLADHPFNLAPIGTGAYQIEALRADSSGKLNIVDLRAAPVYRTRPEGQVGYAIDRMRFQLFESFDAARSALESGLVDGLAARNRTEREALLTLPNINIHTAIDPTLGVLIFNWNRDTARFFREQRVRVALQTGLDRSSIIARYLSNQAVVANSPLIPGSWAYSGNLLWPTPDSNAARNMLENANPRLSDEQATAAASAGIRFSFRILAPGDSAMSQIAGEIAAQWAQLGIGVTTDMVDAATYTARLESGDFDAAVVELSMGGSADPDVYNFWDQGQPDGHNYGSMDDRRIAEELERARRDYSGINRAIRYQSFQADFVERAIAVPLYYPLSTYATRLSISGIQMGYEVTPSSRFMTLRNWSFGTGG
jgi:peptide/nickel transport system substrate-binding protein